MGLFHKRERALAQSLVDIALCNPFTIERVRAEELVLGAAVVETGGVWRVQPGVVDQRENISRYTAMAGALAGELRDKLSDGADYNDAELELYGELVYFVMYHRLSDGLEEMALSAEAEGRRQCGVFDEFEAMAQHYFLLASVRLPAIERLGHMMALFFQARRAFLFIFQSIVGGSRAAADLRAAIWESVFTHDMARYQRSLYERMGELTTLITGPSGTGKELVARAIGFSRYIPFDVKRRSFVSDFASGFYPVNLSALSSTLIESELFGHKKGAFTGATGDRRGYFEESGPLGTVFLDEIGEASEDIQVKLLRLLQTRTFQRLGDTAQRQFEGKVVAATNRNIAREIHNGNFRSDFYYRLCSDLITTPSLREQIDDDPRELRGLLTHIARSVAGELEADALADEVYHWIQKSLPADYAWPGNIRELEQCVRNIMVRRTYQPTGGEPDAPAQHVWERIARGETTLEEVARAYCTEVYRQVGTYDGAARLLDVDARTLKAKVDAELLAELERKS